MHPLTTLLGLVLFPLSYAALEARQEESVSVSVTVTADWLYPPDPTDYGTPIVSTTTTTSSSSSPTWEGWGPSYDPPEYGTPSSSRGCRPRPSTWPNASSSTPISTLVTTRPITITTVTTEPWSTVLEPVAPSSSSTEDVPPPVYPVPTFTGCPYHPDEPGKTCGGGYGYPDFPRLAATPEEEGETEEVGLASGAGAVAGSVWVGFVAVLAML